MPSDFGGRPGSEVSMSHVFPQGVLVAITLVGVRTGDGGAGPELGMSQGFSSAQWPTPPYWGQKLLGQKP